jgi:hypothetical protein
MLVHHPIKHIVIYFREIHFIHFVESHTTPLLSLSGAYAVGVSGCVNYVYGAYAGVAQPFYVIFHYTNGTDANNSLWGVVWKLKNDCVPPCDFACTAFLALGIFPITDGA